MNEIKKVMLIKDLLKRLDMLYNTCVMDEDFSKCDGDCAECLDTIEGSKKALQGLEEGVIEIAPEILRILNKKVGQPLLFSKRMAMCRMFRHWYHSKPEYIGYNTDMFFISYLDKKGWLNTQKIMDQLTDSRIKAILGEGVGEKLISDEKKEEPGIEKFKARIEKIRKKHGIKKSEDKG